MPPAPLQSIGGETITVSTFRFAGNTLLTNEQLTNAVSGFVGRPIDFAGLQNAAIAVASAYRKAGWVVRAYLPQQEITGDAVTIQIVEAKFGAVRLEGEAIRTSEKRLKRMVEARQKPGAPLKATALDRSLLLINDLPGVSATGRLAPGVHHSDADLALAVVDEALVDGGLTVDNAGSRFTGAERAIAIASLNNRLGIGDQADAVILHGKGSDYVRLAYSWPVGASGWRIGANASHLDYEIITRDFAALDAHGASTTVGLQTMYPLVRSQLGNLYVTFDGDDSRFENRSAGQTTTDYSVRSAEFAVHGNRFDTFFGGGASTASLALIEGKMDLSGSPNELADSLTTQTNGSFRKLRLSASRLQTVNDRLALLLGFEGQLASRNLDSSEKIYLGGSQAVRAYPDAEAGGSEGMLAKLEARTKVTDSINVTTFVDWGQVRINKNNDITGAVADNSVSLKGAGLSVGWIADFGLNVSATYARRIGSNPNATIDGKDQDGTLVKNRLWLQASMPF